MARRAAVSQALFGTRSEEIGKFQTSPKHTQTLHGTGILTDQLGVVDFRGPCIIWDISVPVAVDDDDDDDDDGY